MSQFLTPTRDELYDSLRLTDIAKSNESLEPSPRKYIKIEDYENTPLETQDSSSYNKIIIPIPLKQPVSASKQGQRMLINPNLKIKMLNLYISHAIIQEEDDIFNCIQSQK
ncbi:unnamed protein product (macronuclear) [Paramecium tetraurelia]|uniref:Uncharacterized protein n=1 Tax=Paramecium tetraurelia TaxID=5888 RepID=A0ED22_PARTE|nr:uncharacterized protein GSPATT00004058001 [Paramecium tetraurelia]CAK93189.1 unnamed protein product [Paramecium tetraurelia]|eukprot:XP_001460586.1 hypothetical protein (macronuclear) [Paramecium tetraurelia strain d4-2]